MGEIKPTIEDRHFVEQIDTVLSGGNPQSGMLYEQVARMILLREQSKLAAAQAEKQGCMNSVTLICATFPNAASYIKQIESECNRLVKKLAETRDQLKISREASRKALAVLETP